MAYSRWTLLGQQAGAGLSQGLNEALNEKLKFKRIEDFAKRYNLNPQAVALASMGINAPQGPSFQERLLSQVLGVPLPQQDSGFPSILNTPAEGQPFQSPSESPTTVIPRKNGVSQVIAADQAGQSLKQAFTTPPANAQAFTDPQTGKIFYDYNGALYDEQGFAVDDDGNRI